MNRFNNAYLLDTFGRDPSADQERALATLLAVWGPLTSHASPPVAAAVFGGARPCRRVTDTLADRPARPARRGRGLGRERPVPDELGRARPHRAAARVRARGLQAPARPRPPPPPRRRAGRRPRRGPRAGQARRGSPPAGRSSATTRPGRPSSAADAVALLRPRDASASACAAPPLAAVNLVESSLNRLRSDSVADAQGPMQFIDATWKAYGLGGDVHDPRDAILGAANYLHANGAPDDTPARSTTTTRAALYVDAVLRLARHMRTAAEFRFYYARSLFVRAAPAGTGTAAIAGPVNEPGRRPRPAALPGPLHRRAGRVPRRPARPRAAAHGLPVAARRRRSTPSAPPRRAAHRRPPRRRRVRPPPLRRRHPARAPASRSTRSTPTSSPSPARELGGARLGLRCGRRRRPDRPLRRAPTSSSATPSTGTEIPARLATPAFAAEVRRVLGDDGLYLLNVIDAPPWDRATAQGRLLRADVRHACCASAPARSSAAARPATCCWPPPRRRCGARRWRERSRAGRSPVRCANARFSELHR